MEQAAAVTNPTPIAAFDGIYQKHKHCANCLLKNADLNGNYRLRCRSCGYAWNPDKLEFIGNAKLIAALPVLALECARIRYPAAAEDELAWRAETTLAWLREVCFWYDDKTEAEKYVVRFNMFTRLLELKTTANV